MGIFCYYRECTLMHSDLPRLLHITNVETDTEDEDMYW